MGKMPFVGLIGACSLGVMLSGCASPNKNGPTYAGGKADRGMGLLGQRTKNQSTQVPAPIDDAAGSSLSAPSAGGSGGSFIPRGSSGSSSGVSGTGMGMPNNSATMTPMSGGSALPLNGSPAAPPSANPMGSGALSSPMSSGNLASPMGSSMGGNQSSPSPIRQTSYRPDDLSAVKPAALSSSDGDNAPNASMSSVGRTLPPPPPLDDLDAPQAPAKTSSTAAKSMTNSNIYPYPPSPPPQSSSAPPPPSVPPSMSMGATSSMSSPSAPPPTSSSSLSMPSYMMKQ